jgi:1-deoxy-D-xylulose-5-phosphate reductoisomerase
MRRISILGATGSIGQNTLDLIKRCPDEYQIVTLTGGRNVTKLAQQAIEFRAEIAVTAHEDCLPALQAALAGSDIEAAAGPQALVEAAARPADWVMSAIVGAAGLVPGLAALEQGATLALANKESLVSAGPYLMAKARQHKATILPVDSEHSAVFQSLLGENIETVERVIITASGGPFREMTLQQMRHVTPNQAQQHPNWNMGQRITIDSASMFNKAMEIIETREFFGFSPKQIEVLVHPESLIHALVGFNDGGLIAHVGPPDMRHAIGFSLNWPNRKALPLARLDFPSIGKFTFERADEVRFPALRLAREVMETGGLAGAAFNGAKEAALDGFIAGAIGFTQMAEVVEAVLIAMSGDLPLANLDMTLEAALETDQIARRQAAQIIAARKG